MYASAKTTCIFDRTENTIQEKSVYVCATLVFQVILCSFYLIWLLFSKYILSTGGKQEKALDLLEMHFCLCVREIRHSILMQSMLVMLLYSAYLSKVFKVFLHCVLKYYGILMQR